MNSNLVFHYTSINALKSLIESIEISKEKDCLLFRASNILFMNDPNEFVYGRKIFLKTIVEIEDKLDIKNKYRLSSKWIGKTPEEEKVKEAEYMRYLQKIKEIPYVLSLSKLEDSLPMWLNYGDGGKGVCLVFQDNRNQPLKRRMTRNGEEVYVSFYTSDVHYDSIGRESELYGLLYDTLKDYKKDIQKGCADNDAYFDTLIQYAAPFIKNNHYRNECEVRMSKTIGSLNPSNEYKAKFRCNKYGHIIPYIDVEINVDQLKYIILGPLVNFELTKMALGLMAERYIGKDIIIIPSKVQYREY